MAIITGDHRANSIYGTAESDTISGLGGDDELYGNEGTGREADTFHGGAGDDRIFGDFDELSTFDVDDRPGDRAYGGGGDDELYGMEADDRLRGGAGADRLEGGPGDDVLAGDAGRDRFVYSAEFVDFSSGIIFGDSGDDVIADFQDGRDKLFFFAATDAVRDSPESPGPVLEGFADLDTNGNRRLDDGDAHVEVRDVGFGGRTERSTVIDVGGFVEDVPGGLSLTVLGATGLTAADFTSAFWP